MVEEFVSRQAGVITRVQALGCGMTDGELRARVNGGRWQRPYAGVYITYSGPVSRASQLWAALLRCGAGAVLSHETAAELDGLIDDPSRVIHVTIPPTRRVAAPPGIRIHYSRRATEARHPVREPARTRVEETIVDLTQTARTLDDAMGWIARACGRRRTTAGRIAGVMRARHSLRWRAELELAVDDAAQGAHSLLEMRYVRDVERAHGLPIAKRQVIAVRGGRRQFKDAEYEEFGVVVEIDGLGAHPEELRWRDMRRDNAVVADGQAPLRYGTADLTDTPCAVAAQLARVLKLNGWPGSPRACSADCAVRAIA